MWRDGAQRQMRRSREKAGCICGEGEAQRGRAEGSVPGRVALLNSALTLSFVLLPSGSMDL
jgi:hypothetical protein